MNSRAQLWPVCCIGLVSLSFWLAGAGIQCRHPSPEGDHKDADSTPHWAPLCRWLGAHLWGPITPATLIYQHPSPLKGKLSQKIFFGTVYLWIARATRVTFCTWSFSKASSLCPFQLSILCRSKIEKYLNARANLAFSDNRMQKNAKTDKYQGLLEPLVVHAPSRTSSSSCTLH